MSQDNPGGRHDATNSWNGYNHQGKIALYYAVDEIIKLFMANPDPKTAEEKLASTFLEIEWTEDFSIGVIDADGNKRYQTVHQVKDRQDVKLDKYESAIQGLAVNLVKYPETQKAYLHVTTELSEDPGEQPFRDTVKEYVKDLQWIDAQISDGEKVVAEKLAAFTKIPVTQKKTKEKAKAALEEKQQNLEQTKEQKRKLQQLAGDPGRLADIEVFRYDLDGQQEYYCSKKNAKVLVLRSLKNFYRLRYPNVAYKHGDDYIKKSYQYLLVQLNDHVVYRAQNRNSKTVRRDIPFSDLVAWLTTDEIENMGEDYYLYHIKEGYFEYLDTFCTGCKLEHCETCQVRSFKGRFRCMKSEELSAFIHQTNPNVPGAITIEQYHKFLQKNGIRDPFWDGLRKISQTPEELQNSNTVKYRGSDKQTYILTTLAASTSMEDDEDEELAQKELAEEVKMICTEIYKNQTKHGLHLEGKCLLSKNIDVESVQERALTIRPSDIFCDRNHIAVSERIGIVPVRKFRKKYMRKEQEKA